MFCSHFTASAAVSRHRLSSHAFHFSPLIFSHQACCTRSARIVSADKHDSRPVQQINAAPGMAATPNFLTKVLTRDIRQAEVLRIVLAIFLDIFRKPVFTSRAEEILNVLGQQNIHIDLFKKSQKDRRLRFHCVIARQSLREQAVLRIRFTTVFFSHRFVSQHCSFSTKLWGYRMTFWHCFE